MHVGILENQKATPCASSSCLAEHILAEEVVCFNSFLLAATSLMAEQACRNSISSAGSGVLLHCNTLHCTLALRSWLILQSADCFQITNYIVTKNLKFFAYH